MSDLDALGEHRSEMAAIELPRKHCSIIIPAHDESRVLARLLQQIASIADDCEVIVVANGCTDDTAAVAASFSWCTCIETPVASKVVALNAGDAVAHGQGRIYLDADVSVSPDTLRSLAAAISTPHPIVASPRVEIDSLGASLPARAYQRIWGMTDYRRDNHTGSGIYALSPAGRRRFGMFPDLISDDLYVRLLFSDAERRVTEGEPFTVFAPRTLRSQIRRLGRTMAGEMQLARTRSDVTSSHLGDGARGHLLGRVARDPRRWADFLVYVIAYGAGRVLARNKTRSHQLQTWERDLTTR